MAEPIITINGVTLSQGQAMTVRVLLTNAEAAMLADDALGDDEHARRMTKAYADRLGEIMPLLQKD